MVSKHVKPKKMGEQGGIIKAEGAMYASKVQIVCPRCKSLQELLISSMRTALRAEFALNAAKHFKEEIRYGKT